MSWLELLGYVFVVVLACAIGVTIWSIFDRGWQYKYDAIFDYVSAICGLIVLFTLTLGLALLLAWLAGVQTTACV